MSRYKLCFRDINTCSAAVQWADINCALRADSGQSSTLHLRNNKSNFYSVEGSIGLAFKINRTGINKDKTTMYFLSKYNNYYIYDAKDFVLGMIIKG